MTNTIFASTVGGLAIACIPACYSGAEPSSGSTGEAGSTGQAAEADESDDANSPESTESDGAPPPTEICDELGFDNVVDEAACPDIAGLGIELVPADSVEFCRRAFIDLLGASPTAVDFEEHCKNRTPDEIIDDFVLRPEYVRLGQRMWADVFHMNSSITYYGYLESLDALAGQLHRGEIGLTAFAEIAATHPGFVGRWDGVDLVGFNFLAHFRRDANPAERLALQPLWAMWAERDYDDPLQAGTKRVVLDTLACAPPFEARCHSDLWGEHLVRIEPPVPGNTDPNGPNVLDVATLTEAQWATLRTPGRAIAGQGGFYEAYVDRALVRYLGYDAGNELPAVRQALVELLLAADGNVLVVDREILKSGLYTSTNAHDEPLEDNADDYDPPWWHGPVKQMDAEAWLASARKLVGVQPGTCDRRYPDVQSGPAGFHPHEYPLGTDGVSPDYVFRDEARLLGGCPDRVSSFREVRAGLIAALTQATLTKRLCESALPGAQIFPQQFIEDPDDKSGPALANAAEQIYASALVRPIPEGADEALQRGVEGCRDQTDCTPNDFAYHTCRLVLKSADFLFY